jgi:hypothetical protein
MDEGEQSQKERKKSRGRNLFGCYNMRGTSTKIVVVSVYERLFEYWESNPELSLH